MMDDILIAFLAGSLIPVAAVFIKKIIIDKVFDGENKEIKIKTSTGKERHYIVNDKLMDIEIFKLVEDELTFEEEVKKSLINYIRKNNNNIRLIEGSNVDFILEFNNKKIAVEAKSTLKNYKVNWAKKYISDKEGINDIIFIVNSKISAEKIKGIESVIGSDNVKFISTKKDKKLINSIESLINDKFS